MDQFSHVGDCLTGEGLPDEWAVKISVKGGNAKVSIVANGHETKGMDVPDAGFSALSIALAQVLGYVTDREWQNLQARRHANGWRPH